MSSGENRFQPSYESSVFTINDFAKMRKLADGHVVSSKVMTYSTYV